MSLCSHFLSQEECEPCLPGYYCDTEGLLVPSGQCWEGFFCLEGADRPDPPLRDSRGGPCPEGDQTLWRTTVSEICKRDIRIVCRIAVCNTGLDNQGLIVRNAKKIDHLKLPVTLKLPISLGRQKGLLS